MRRVNGLIAPLVLCLIAFALRVFRLDVQSLWYDEAFSVYLAQFDLASITARTAADIQPPLYYYLLHFWLAFVGDREFSARFLSLVFGVLTIPLIYITARRLSANRVAAFIAALLAMISPLYVWYSQEARMYTLITFLVLLSSYALLRALTPTLTPFGVDGGGVEREWWITFALANSAAIYTHYFAFVVIAFQLLFGLVSSFKVSGFKLFNLKLETLKPLTIVFAAIFLAFLPWFPFVLARFGQDVSYWRGALKLDEAIRHIFIVFTTGESVLEAQAQWIAVGWLGCLVVGLFAWASQKSKVKSQKSNHSIVFLVLYLLVPLALLLILFSRNPKFNARYLMIASPPFFLLLAAGLASISRITHHASRISLSLFTFSFLLFASAQADYNAYFDPAFTKADFRGVARHIEKNIARGEAIILTSGHLFPAFNYYFRGDTPVIRLPDDATLNADHVLGFEAGNVLNQTLAGKRGVWMVQWQDEVVDPNTFLPIALSSRGKEQTVDARFWHVRLRHWILDPNARFSAEPEPQIKRDANFKNVVALLGATPTPTPAEIGASFNLAWRALAAPNDDYTVALSVRDAAGNVWGRQDRRPAGYNYPTTRWKPDEKIVSAFSVPLLAGAPPGDYFVEITVYTKDDPRGLDVIAPNGAPIGKSARVGPLPVLPPTKPATLAALDTLRENMISQPIGAFTLLGYRLGRDRASAGEMISLTLFWRADSKPDRDYTFRVQFGDTTSDALPLANLQSPTSTWRAGEIVRGQYLIPLPADAKPGTVNLRVALSDGNALDLAPFTIEKTDRVFVKPNAQFTQSANFANAIALAGYQLPITNYRPGDTLKLTLFWNARNKMDKPYTVFVHLLDKDGKVVAQQDAQPANGARPTTGWVAGEYLADNYDLPIAANIAPGTYRIEIGWYDAQDPAFARLQVLDDNGIPVGDQIILQASIVVQ